MILFGSYAYGQPTEDSDVDLLILVDTQEPPIHVAAQIAAAGCLATGAAKGAFCTPPTGQSGTLGRNILRGPAFKELNFSVFKRTAITERLNLQIGADFFNIFNHPNFSNPNLPNFITDAANNGLDASGRGIGLLPLTATGDVGIGNPFLGGGGPRGVQFSAKITF